MAECGRLGPGGGWARILVVFVTGSVLAGCVSVETIKKREKESEGYYQQGLSVLNTDQQRAFVSFQKAIQANPNNYDAHYLLGHVYFLRKEYTDAEREFRTCVSLDPNSGEALNYLGRTLVFMSRLPEAIAALRKAVTLPLYGTPDMAYVNLGAALHQQGDIPGAIRAYQDALKIDPPNVPRALVYLELGRLHMQQGEDSKARDAFAQAKALDPQGTAGAEAAKMMKQLR
jgi:type IV pilus biogenesis/stability protein PilW